MKADALRVGLWVAETAAPIDRAAGSRQSLRQLSRRARRGAAKILPEMTERAHHRHRRQAAHRAQRSVDHQLIETVEQREILLALHAGDDPIDRLYAAHRADAAGRAFAATFLGGKLKGDARLLRDVTLLSDTTPPWPGMLALRAISIAARRPQGRAPPADQAGGCGDHSVLCRVFRYSRTLQSC